MGIQVIQHRVKGLGLDIRCAYYMGLGFKILSCAAENFGYRPTGTRLGIWHMI